MSPTRIHFVIDDADSTAALYQSLVDLGEEAVLIQPSEDLERIEQYLVDSGYALQSVDEISIYAHGSRALVDLGKGSLDISTLGRNAGYLEVIGQYLSPEGGLNLWGCNVAKGDTGQFFLDSLSSIAKREVRASSDKTGIGGDWTLEKVSGFRDPRPFRSDLDYDSIWLGSLMVDVDLEGTVLTVAFDDAISDAINVEIDSTGWSLTGAIVGQYTGTVTAVTVTDDGTRFYSTEALSVSQELTDWLSVDSNVADFEMWSSLKARQVDIWADTTVLTDDIETSSSQYYGGEELVLANDIQLSFATSLVIDCELINQSKESIELTLMPLDSADIKLGSLDSNDSVTYYAAVTNSDGTQVYSQTTYDPTTDSGTSHYDFDLDDDVDLVVVKIQPSSGGDSLATALIDSSQASDSYQAYLKRRVKPGTRLAPEISSGNKDNWLQVSDPSNSDVESSFCLHVELEKYSSGSTEIGYVVAREDERVARDSYFSDINMLKTRGRALFTSIDASDVYLPQGIDSKQQFLVPNGSNVRFYALEDAALSEVQSIEDSRLSFLNVSRRDDGSFSLISENGVEIGLSLGSDLQSLNSLISRQQSHAPVLDLTALGKDQKVLGTLSQAREADFDAVTGFYRVEDTSGTVKAVDGSLLRPGDPGYREAALSQGNVVMELLDLQVEDDSYATLEIQLSTADSYYAPFANVDEQVYFAFADANPDGISHFRSLGANQFGLEDMYGGGDLDFDDHIVAFDFSSVV